MKTVNGQPDHYRFNLASLVFICLIILGMGPIIIFFLFTQQKITHELKALEEEQHIHRFQDSLTQLESKIDSYQNMIGFVSQLPAVFEILNHGNDMAGAIDQTTADQRYTGVLSRAFQENNEVVSIHILGPDRQVQFSLMRDPRSRKYHRSDAHTHAIEPFLLDKAFALPKKEFVLSPLIESREFSEEQGGSRLILRILTPIFVKGTRVGMFCSDIDIGILIRNFPDIHWVRNDGQYLSSSQQHSENAFDLFPGLEKLFHTGQAGVWRAPQSIMVWDPFFKGENDSLILWAGKEITLNTLQDTLRNILMSGLTIFIVLSVLLLLISLFFARYTKRYTAAFLGHLKRSILEKQNTFPASTQKIREFHEFSDNLAGILEQNRQLEKERQQTLKDLQKALEEVKTLQGIIPICAICKNIRNDEGYYEKIESYLHKHTGVGFTHGLCPECMRTHYPEEYKLMMAKKNS